MIGASQPRPEDRALITGAAPYVADLAEPGTLRIALVRSHVAHGRITSIDRAEAEAAPGVVAVYTAADLDLADVGLGELGEGSEDDVANASVDDGGNAQMKRHPLARGVVRFAGEPLAAVVAETDYQAADAAELIWAEIDPLPTVDGPRAALEGDTLLFPEVGTNVVLHRHTAVGAADDDPVTASIEVTEARLAQSPLENPAVLAVPDADGSLTIWCGHQAPHHFRREAARVLRVPEERLRVRVPRVGGGFGLKGVLIPEYLVAAAAALRLGRPVLWTSGRREAFLGGTHGRGQINRVTLGGDESGRIRSLRFETLADAGAYPQTGAALPLNTAYMAPGPYDLAAVEIETVVVVANRAPIGPYRGAGRPEATYALERGIDAFARRIGMDPAEVRRINLIRPEAMPFRTATGAVYDGGDYAAALDRALELVDAAGIRSEQAARRAGGGRPLGLGLSCFVDRSGGGITSGEYGAVGISAAGRVEVRTGSVDLGQGLRTSFAQIAAGVLEVPLDLVDVFTGDTVEVDHGIGTFGSRCTQLGGSAVWRMAVEVAGMVRAAAADILGVEASEVDSADGEYRVAAAPGRTVSLAEVARFAAEAGPELRAEEDFVPGYQTFPYGVYAAVAEVDPETGVVALIDLVGVNDFGKVINPLLADGQILGSVAQGAGQALLEGLEYDAEGQLQTSSFVDYLLPTASDLVPLRLDRLETPAPSNPLGVKGIGESGTIGVPAAVVNAVLDALEPFGVTELDTPLSPRRVWEALQKAAT